MIDVIRHVVTILSSSSAHQFRWADVVKQLRELGELLPGGYKNLVIGLQILMVAAILSLIPLLPEVLQLGGRPGAEKLRWSLFGVAMSNAISDLCLDAFALRWLRGRW